MDAGREFDAADIVAAWEIVSARPDGWTLYALRDMHLDGTAWECVLWRKADNEFEYITEYGDTAPQAICLAVHRAVGVV